jgi:hypothetical protein
VDLNKLRVSRIGYLFFLVLASYTAASAQVAGGLGGSFNDPAGKTVTRTIVDRVARRRLENRRAVRPTGNDAAVHFRSTGTQLKTREIANIIDAGNAQVFNIMSTILTEYEKGARAAGHPNDLALALSFFFATNASIYHNAGEPADPAMMELRDAITEALVEGKTLNGVTDRQKQEMYETLVIFTGFALATYQEGKQGGSAETIKVSRQLAGQNLLAVTGISPDKISFSAQGLSIDNGDNAASNAATSSAQSNTGPSTSPAPAAKLSNADFLDFDPFPDKPYIQPQKPLIGRLRKTITTDDLAGTWEIGGAAVTTYVSSGTGAYTDASFFGKKYFIRADGTYDSKFQGRASNTTIRESDSGSVILSGGFITMKSRQNPAMRYQFVAFMSQPNGAAVLSLIYIGDNAPLDGEALRANCGHANGYVSCLNGEEWVRIP